ncbi:hypothetical protein EMIHUDRAFT_317942 [Emiliania huxleyi CCMP1516]|uniref:Uncharacterized protein n=2 Tax=Emiliania huxleyi TaxID=2903 RepID=A0A0D3IUX2_EMIH1|nr:hypothetical protein EMIHUDRAFT_317942 [Emiliania huxleyi CCMP1516]EOD15057.1 hypothetical protein EMIHUDRAFT_317942 [Emiliania huxleyi CCMP1516]|eukprot:XP_005767486.1 hypothetical protein EMIHUDRAFT_317942 [Emiliania huxleyi CCMP1516]
MSHKVELDRRSIKKRILQLDCAGKLPPQSSRRPAASSRRGPWRAPERERGRVRMAQAGQKVCGDGTVAGVRRRARRTRAAEGRSVPAREPRERVQKELAVTRCRAVVVLWRLCTVGKVRLQQRSTMVVPRCSLA